jgi:threonine aldolase
LIPVPTENGKLTPSLLKQYLVRLGDQHSSQPAAFSITQPTELGTLYTLEELRALGDFAKDNNLRFHMDGARLTNAASALSCTLEQTSFEVGVDALSFGGTKHGLLHCEAVILKDKPLAKVFKYRRKQAMQLPSKTRFIAAQFTAFFKDDLWREIAQASNQQASRLRALAQQFPELTFPHPTQASAVFACIPKQWLKPLRSTRFFYVWDPETMLVRWTLGYDTDDADIDALRDCLARLSAGLV